LNTNALARASVSSPPLLKVVRWRRSPGEPNQPRPPEEHGWLAISFCHVGALAGVLAGGSEVVADANTALLNRGQPTCVATKARVQAIGVEVRLNHSFLQSCRVAHALTSSSDVTSVTPRVRWTEALLVRSAQAGDLKETTALAAHLVQQLFQSGGVGGVATPVPESGRRRVTAAKLILAASLAEPCALSTVAARVNSSPSYLAQLFRGVTGLSFHQYKLQLRLSAAVETLATTNSPLTDIALALGFSHHSHFTSVFRSRFGVTPSEARGVLRGRRRAPRREDARDERLMGQGLGPPPSAWGTQDF
jgi:AraC-like DNA-binding protein